MSHVERVSEEVTDCKTKTAEDEIKQTKNTCRE